MQKHRSDEQGKFHTCPAPALMIQLRYPERRNWTEMKLIRWGRDTAPRTGGPPVTNVSNASTPYWRGWLKPESRCPQMIEGGRAGRARRPRFSFRDRVS